MSEELLQRDLIKNPEKIGPWLFYNIGSTTLKALKEAGIIRNVDYGEFERKKVDGLIVQEKNVIAVIEYKKPSEFKSLRQKDKAVTQESEVAKKLNAPLLIATDTKESIWINVFSGKQILDESGTKLSAVFNPRADSMIVLIERIIDSINELNDQIKPKELINPTNLAKKIWQDIWSVSGATPENCLYTFIELFIFKYLSDLGVLKGVYCFDNLIQGFESNTDEEVLETYAHTIRPKIKVLFPESKDGTTIINGTIFVSKDQKAVQGYSTVFKKVLFRFKDYGKLEHIDYDFKSQLFESFLKESISKKNWGQFFTPLKVVQAISQMAEGEIKAGAKICDPACGVGKFLLEPILTKISQFYKIENGKVKSNISIHGYDKGFDKDEQKTIILAKANMLIYFSELIRDNPGVTEKFAELFNESFILKTNSILGTLSEPVEDAYDLILTNPPYVTSGSSNLKEEIRKSGLEYYYSVNATGVEGLFMEWIIRALKPGGKAFVIVPDGILSRDSDKNLRKFILDECIIDGLISLPSKTFFTTLKKTYILCITKKNDKSYRQVEPVFSYLVSNIGETLDVYRMNIPQNDLNEAAILFNQFKGAKNHFTTDDVRFQTIPINWFNTNYENSWIIETLWDEEELIEMGIKEESNVIKVGEFTSYLESLSLSINEHQAQLKEIILDIKNYKNIGLTDSEYFEIISGGLGMKKNEYSALDTKDSEDIPVYTATLKPVAYFKSGSVKRIPQGASLHDPHISFASDGDGTAGTNIVLHSSPYYINTSRIAFRGLSEKINLKYIFYTIQDIKRKYGFDYKHKATQKNIGKIIIPIPLDFDGNIDLEAQGKIADAYEKIEEIKKSIKEDLLKISEAVIKLD
jgi:type I restriction enzyme M protein